MNPKVDIGIPEAERQAITQGLSKFLADTFTLYLRTHHYHWNVSGPMFSTLHELFEQQYTELWNAIDEVAERIRALDEYAPGTYEQFTKLSGLKDAPGVPSAKQMIANLLEGHEAVARCARSIFPAAEKGGDESTLDFLTGRLQVHEKTAWMLRSLLRD